MFDIGGLELLIIAVVALIVIGPERLPETLRMLGLWLGRLRRSFTAVKSEIEREIGMDEIKRQLHNEAVMEEMKRIEREVQSTADQAKIDPEPTLQPVSEAQLEAANERRMRQQQTEREQAPAQEEDTPRND